MKITDAQEKALMQMAETTGTLFMSHYRGSTLRALYKQGAIIYGMTRRDERCFFLTDKGKQLIKILKVQP